MHTGYWNNKPLMVSSQKEQINRNIVETTHSKSVSNNWNMLREKRLDVKKEKETRASEGYMLETEEIYYRFQLSEMLLILLFIYYML